MERSGMEFSLDDYFESSRKDIENEYRAHMNDILSNPFITESQGSARAADIERDYQIHLDDLKNRIKESMIMGSAQDTYSWTQNGKPMIEAKSKKEINGKESCPELYKLLKARKSIHH